MEYFKYKEENCYTILEQGIQYGLNSDAFVGGKKSGTARFICDSCNIDKLAPIKLTPAGIKTLLYHIRADKESFKKFVQNFEGLQIYEKINGIKKFYTYNSYPLQQLQLTYWKNEFPEEKKLKTNLLIEDSHGVRRAESLNIRAKKGVKFNAFKTYKLKDINELVSAGKIVVIGAKCEEKVDFNEAYIKEQGCFPIIVLHDGFRKTTILSEGCFENMQLKNPKVAEALINDVCFEEVKIDYETKYLPAYKECLKYLLECAKDGPKREEATKEALLELIKKSNEKAEEYKNITKEIMGDADKER